MTNTLRAASYKTKARDNLATNIVVAKTQNWSASWLLGRAQPVILPNLYNVNEHNSMGPQVTSWWLEAPGGGRALLQAQGLWIEQHGFMNL